MATNKVLSFCDSKQQINMNCNQDEFLNDNTRVNRILNILLRADKFPVFGTNQKPWRYSLNLSTKSKDNDMTFSVMQFEGCKRVIEEYRWSEMRPKFKRYPQYEEWLWGDIFMSLSRMHMHMKRKQGGIHETGWSHWPKEQPDKLWKPWEEAALRKPNFLNDYKLIPDMQGDWDGSCWIADTPEQLKRRQETFEACENMKRYIRFARKCAIEEKKLELISQRHKHYSFLAMCQSMMPCILPSEVSLPYEEEDVFLEEVVVEKPIVFEEPEMEWDDSSLTHVSYSHRENVDTVDSSTQTFCMKSFRNQESQTIDVELSDKSHCVIQSDQTFLSAQAGTYADTVSFKTVCGQVESMQFLCNKRDPYVFRKPYPHDWATPMSHLLEEYEWQTDGMRAEIQDMRVLRVLPNLLRQMRSCIKGRRVDKHERTAKMFLQALKDANVLKDPMSSISFDIARFHLKEMLEHFTIEHTAPHLIGVHRQLLHQFILYNICYQLLNRDSNYASDQVLTCQGDNTGEVLEKTEDLVKTQNVTMLHERPVNTVSVHQGNEDVTKESTEISETPYSYKQLLERNIFIDHVNWNTTWKRGDTTTWGLPLALLHGTNLDFNALRMAGFLHTDLHITIIMNASKFTKGLMLFGITPIMLQDDWDEVSSMNNFNFPSGVLNSAVSNVLEFRVPFSHFLSYLPQQNGKLKDGLSCNMGFLFCTSIVPLQVPEGVPSTVDIEIYGRFVNPTIHQTITPFSSFGYVNKFMSVTAPAAPQLVTQGDDKPIVNRTVEPIVRRSEDAQVLGFQAIEQIKPVESSVSSDYSLAELIRIPSLLTSFNWKYTHNAGDYLWSWTVSPSFFESERYEEKTNGATYNPTMLSYVSRGFMYYNGDIILKFQMIKTDFETGRYKIYQDPTWISSEGVKYDRYATSNVNSVIVDLQQQNEIEVRIPFTSIKPLLRCDRWRTQSSPTSYLGEYHQGMVGVQVVNKLVGVPNFSADVVCNVYIYGAENFRVCIPVPLYNLSLDYNENTVNYNWYPFNQVDKHTDLSVAFDNKDYILEIYHKGLILVKNGLIIPHSTMWYRAQTDLKFASEEALKWRNDVRQLYDSYNAASRQLKFMASLPNYTLDKDYDKILRDILAAIKAIPKVSMLETQAFERYVTPNEEHPAAILLTKNNRSNVSKVMDAEFRELHEVLSRFYPYTVIRPIIGLCEYTCITIPVCPFLTQEMRESMGSSISTETSHLEWFSRLFNWWEGALLFKMLYNRTNAEVVAVFMPNDPSGFRVTKGHDPQEVQRALTFGSNIGVTHVQGGIEVAVPFQSSYNQLMIPKKYYAPDLRWQNGSLRFYIRNLQKLDCVTPFVATILIAAGKDFKMNWIVPPPYVYESSTMVSAGTGTFVKSVETKMNIDNYHQSFLSLDNTDYPIPNKVLEWTNYVVPQLADIEEETEGEDLVSQGLGEVVNSITSTIHNVNQASTSIPITLEQVSKDVSNSANHLNRESSKISGDINEIKESLTRNLNVVTSDFKTLASKVTGVSENLSYYIDLTATTMLTGNVIRAFVVAVREPGTPGRWIDLGLSFAALLGFSIKHIIVQCVQNVLDWFHPNEQSRAQALSGAILNEIESNEDTILKSVAVLGTILYAYIFECLPDFSNIKNKIKELLNRDPKLNTQGLNLRAAHFGLLGMTALSRVFENIIYYTRKFMDWVLERASPEALLARKAAQIQERVLKLIQNLDKYDNEYEILQALQDPEIHNHFYGMMDEANDLTKIFIEQKLDARIGQLLTECRTRTKALIKRLEAESPACGWRFDPYIVFIHGASGTGKSNIMRELMKVVADEWKLPKYNQVYAKTVKDEFWSGYTAQPMVQWDEFGQNPENDGEAMEIVELRSNLPKRLNMAALHEKGRYFASKAIFVTTNVPYYKFDKAVRDDVAYRRRRNLMVEMAFKDGFNETNVQNLPKFDKTYGHCKFRFSDPMFEDQHQNRGWISLDEIKATLKQCVHDWGVKQQSLYEDYIEQHGLGVLPRGVVNISAPVEYHSSMSESAIMSAISSAAASIVERVHSPLFTKKEEVLPVHSVDELTKVCQQIVKEQSHQNFYQDQAPPNSPVNTVLHHDLPDSWEFKNMCVTQGVDRPLGRASSENCLIEVESYDWPGRVYPGKSSPPCYVSFDDLKISPEATKAIKERFSVQELCTKPLPSSVCSPPVNGSESTVNFLVPSSIGSCPDSVSTVNISNFLCRYNAAATFPMTKEEYMYVLGHTLDLEEWKKLSEEEKEIAKRFLENQRTTVSLYSKPPSIVNKSWYERCKNTVSFLYHKACKIFSSIKECVCNFVNNNPRISIGLAILGSLGALAGTLWMINSEVEPKEFQDAVAHPNWKKNKDDFVDVELVEIELEDDMWNAVEGKNRVTHKISDWYPQDIAENAKYDHNTKRPILRRVVAQGCEDPNAIQIRERVHPNLIMCGWPEGSTKRSVMRALHLRGSLILVPFHFFSGAKEGESFCLLHRNNYVYVEFNLNRLYRKETYDWVVYNCGARLEPRKDIVRHFISERDLYKIPKVPFMLCNIEQNGTHLYANGMARAVTEYQYKDDSSDEIYVQNGWETNCCTAAGDCGSFLLALNKSLSGPGKIIGIHTAGRAGANKGFGVLVTCEMLEEACEKFKVVMGLPIPPEVNTSAQALLRVVPSGDYSIYGAVPNTMAPSQPQKSDFQIVPFRNDDVKDIPCLRKPAHLYPFINSNGEKVSPLIKALEKYGKLTKPFSLRNIHKVKEHIVNIFKNKLEKSGHGIFSEEQAVLGIVGNDFAKPLNLVSSPGWPYQVLQKDKKGKRHLFNEKGQVIDTELRKRLDERLQFAKKGERVPSLWRDCLKDELRPNAKVDAGKSRLFTIAPVDFNILVRRYFMDFNLAFYSANNDIFSAVGMDPESFDWTRMYQRLAEKGTKTIAGDYGSFDGTLMADLMEVVGDIINEWYDDGEENAQVRRVLINEMIHTMQLVENTVYATHQGNPSGNPLTVILNTIINYFYLCLAFLEIYPDATLDDFVKYIVCICYGDDMLATVMAHFSKFNQVNLTRVFADHGIEFTSEAKDGRDVGEFRELTEVTFLKRGFKKDKEWGNQFWLATMSEETLTSFFHWVRHSPDPEMQLQDNMRACLRFAAFHGREKYNWYLQKWTTCMRNISYSPIMITYEEQIDAFHHTVGMLHRDQRFHGLIEKMIVEGNEESNLGEIIKKEELKEEQQPSLFRKFCRIWWEVSKFYGAYYLTTHVIDLCLDANAKFFDRNNQAMEKRTDDRWAYCIPSGEGKTTLAQKYPKIFVDQDDYILDQDKLAAGEFACKASIREFLIKRCKEEFDKEPEQLTFWEKCKFNNGMAGIYESWARKKDVDDSSDRRILLTHHPRNTKRQILGCFILPQPTNIRQNTLGRQALMELNPLILSYEERESVMLAKAKVEEASLFN